MRLRSWLGWAVLVALAGCAKPTDQGGAAQGAHAGGPARRPGLWDQRVVLGGAVQTGRLCLDAETDRALSWWGVASPADICGHRLVARRPDGRWRFSLVCDMGGGGRVTTSGVAEGDFASHYRLAGQASTAGAADRRQNGVRPLSVEATWLGSCPTGLRPGDMILPDGSRISMLAIHV